MKGLLEVGIIVYWASFFLSFDCSIIYIVVIGISSIDQRLEMTQENRMHGFFPDGEIWRMMDLTFEKEIFDDGPNYSVAFGSLCIAPCTREKYCSEGAYLYEEENGRIKDFVEEMISAEKTVEGNT